MKKVVYTGRGYAVIILFVTIAEILLFFLPWLYLESDVHPYMFYEIPKMGAEALWRFDDGLFILPNFFLWATVISLAVAIILQFAEIITVFSGRKLNPKIVKNASAFTIVGCASAILMFFMFWAFLFFGFFPRIALIILPIAVFCQILFTKNCRQEESQQLFDDATTEQKQTLSNEQGAKSAALVLKIASIMLIIGSLMFIGYYGRFYLWKFYLWNIIMVLMYVLLIVSAIFLLPRKSVLGEEYSKLVRKRTALFLLIAAAVWCIYFLHGLYSFIAFTYLSFWGVTRIVNFLFGVGLILFAYSLYKLQRNNVQKFSVVLMILSGFGFVCVCVNHIDSMLSLFSKFPVTIPVINSVVEAITFISFFLLAFAFLLWKQYPVNEPRQINAT